jgi:hypothetical protein
MTCSASLGRCAARAREPFRRYLVVDYRKILTEDLSA